MDPPWNRCPLSLPAPDKDLSEGDVLPVGQLQFQVMHTPGHSPGSVILWEEAEGFVFCGDLLFEGSVGRTDFPGCNVDDMMASLGRIVGLPASTVCFPGHMGQTTVSREREHNPFLASFR